MACRQKRNRLKENIWDGLKGTSEEVICLGFMLDIGNIQEETDSQYREKLIYDMHAQDMYAQEQRGRIWK